MDKQAFKEARLFLDTALFSFEDMVDEMQQNYHALISETTSLRRTLRAVHANLEAVEKSQQQPTP